MYRYEKRDSEYALVDDGRVLFAAPEIAIGFDLDPPVLHKHGPTDLVKAWAAEARRVYRNGGLDDLADGIAVLASSAWDVDDLNRLLANSGFLAALLRREGIIAGAT